MSNRVRINLVIIVTGLIALLLSALPLPHMLNWFRPLWLPLLFCFWAISLRDGVSLSITWVFGLLMDALNGNVMGLHACALIAIIFIINKWQLRFRQFLPFQQGVAVFLLLVFYQAIIYWLQAFVGQRIGDWLYWVAPLSSMLFWPWIRVVLRDFPKQHPWHRDRP